MTLISQCILKPKEPHPFSHTHKHTHKHFVFNTIGRQRIFHSLRAGKEIPPKSTGVPGVLLSGVLRPRQEHTCQQERPSRSCNI